MSYVVQDDDLPEVTLQYDMGTTVSVTTVIDEGDSLELDSQIDKRASRCAGGRYGEPGCRYYQYIGLIRVHPAN